MSNALYISLILMIITVKFLQAMSHYGFEIVQTLIVDIEPDEHVKRAMNEINAGKKLIMLFFVLLFHPFH